MRSGANGTPNAEVFFNRPGTKSAKRRLKKLAGKQKYFQTSTNHLISKQLVTKANATRRAIALEDLTGISKYIRQEEKRLWKSQHSKHSNWTGPLMRFNQLRQFLIYKSVLCGGTLTLVDSRNTSLIRSKSIGLSSRDFGFRGKSPTFGRKWLIVMYWLRNQCLA
ncbi:hypothetical protein AWR27_17570 [Spirosoma montaniterrae]|uniref:Uncharacterized protein n=1 Tax=Spirosoma montaniterrae TaxID=1178516 RepID=A0A1P9X066_9BACT|nr:hypothetical protein AWR27_17570 [Spirosoma montaniterrae]